MIEGTSAFTSKSDKMSNRLTNEVIISSGKKSITVTAQWDTGATTSCISEPVVNALELMPTGKINMQTPTGTAEHNTYLVDIQLPNEVAVSDLQVADSKIDAQGLGVLIGMDIISRGDFAVSNFNGKTAFTFRTPSNEMISFVKDVHIQNLVGQTHGKGKRKKKYK